MSKDQSVELTGYIAAALIIGAYFIVSFDIANSDSVVYQGMNFAAAVIYVWYAIIRKITPVLIVNLACGTIGAVSIYKIIT